MFLGSWILWQKRQQTRNIPDWFVSDDEAYVRKHISEHGYTIVARTVDGQTAGFFIVKYPEGEDNLGHYLDMEEEALGQVVVMDSTVVCSDYRGAGLQGRMLQAAEARIDKEKFHYLMCTIHPDNQFSRQNMESQGYEVKKITKCYGRSGQMHSCKMHLNQIKSSSLLQTARCGLSKQMLKKE